MLSDDLPLSLDLSGGDQASSPGMEDLSLVRARRILGGVMVLLGAVIAGAGLFTGVRLLVGGGGLMIVGGIVRILSAAAK